MIKLLLLSLISLASSVELQNFYLASSDDLPIGTSGITITSPSYIPSAPVWTQANVPCTVVACLMQAGLIPANVFQGDLINQINQTRFNATWFYQTTFTLPSSSSFASLRLLGINYRARIFLNGVDLDESIIGMYTINEVDLTKNAVFGGENKLAISVTRQFDFALGPGHSETVDLGVSFVDWTYSDPPDYNLGLWRRVFVDSHGPVTLRSPGVATSLSQASHHSLALKKQPVSFSEANLTVILEARNYDATVDVVGSLVGQVSTSSGATILCSFSVPLTVTALSEVTVSITVDQVQCLSIQSPQLWWPWQMGEQTLHLLNVSFITLTSNVTSDSISTTFGIRTATSVLDSNGYRLFLFNSLPFLVRGGGWSPDLFQRVNDERLAQQVAITRDLGLNAIRFEGKMEPDELFILMDSVGIVALPGWCCCDAWQNWKTWGSEQYQVAAKSMQSQARRFRKFASMLGFLISSDELPPENVEQLYLDQLNNTKWQLFAASVSAASAATSTLTGPTGVKMSGPYSWVPPNYFLEDNGTQKAGGAWGFLTEGGPGETPLTLESLISILPQNTSAWPPSPNNAWGKAGNPIGNFGLLDRFNTPLINRYGSYNFSDTTVALNDYLAKSAAASIEGHKAFCEAYSRNKYKSSTGFIQWMLNDATPSNIWHFIQFDLTIGPAGVAAKQALAPPLHIAYDYVNRSIYIVNSLYYPAPSMDLFAKIEVFSLADDTLFLMQTTVTANSIASDVVVDVPELQPPMPVVGSGAFFLRLSLLESSSGKMVDLNTYYLPEEEDVIDWSTLTWYNVQVSKYANLTSLFSSVLGQPQGVNATAVFTTVTDNNELTSSGARWLANGQRGGEGPWTSANITIVNNGPNIANLVRLRIVPLGGDSKSVSDPAPVFYTDNFVILRVGESRTLIAEFQDAIFAGKTPTVIWTFAV